MVGGTDTVFCEAVTVLSEVRKMVFFMHSMVPIPATVIIASQKIRLIRGTISPLTKKMVSGFDNTLFVFHNMVPVTKIMVNALNTVVGDDD